MTKILVIEDAQSLRKDIIEMLAYEGYEAVGAENGIVGVERAREELPDMIICDIMMPGMNGLQVLENLHSDPATLSIPFIFLTARTDRDDQREGMNLGADDYLTKPFTAAELIQTVRARLNHVGRVRVHVEQKADQLRKSIILALPHELRTPLNNILGFSDLLMLDADVIKPDQITDMARHINSAGLRLMRLIENFLIYAQTEVIASDPPQLEALKLNYSLYPKSTIERAILNKTPNDRKGDLHVALEDVEAIGAAEDHMRRIVEELIDNAFKFSEPGKPVSITARPEGEMYRIVVRDQGRGMTPEQRASIGAYMQFDRVIYEQQGAGLGLIIARRLAELYGGSLQIESTLGVGTTVRVAIPIRRDALELTNMSPELLQQMPR